MGFLGENEAINLVLEGDFGGHGGHGEFGTGYSKRLNHV